jgi:alpha-1,3-glucosyltransferase
MVGWHILEAFWSPPTDKPDLWTVTNALIGAGGFGICYLWCLWTLIQKSGIMTTSGPKVSGKTQ